MRTKTGDIVKKVNNGLSVMYKDADIEKVFRKYIKTFEIEPEDGTVKNISWFKNAPPANPDLFLTSSTSFKIAASIPKLI